MHFNALYIRNERAEQLCCGQKTVSDETADIKMCLVTSRRVWI